MPSHQRKLDLKMSRNECPNSEDRTISIKCKYFKKFKKKTKKNKKTTF